VAFAGPAVADQPAAPEQPQWIEDPAVMETLRERLAKALSQSANVEKTTSGGTNELIVSGKRLKWGDKKKPGKKGRDKLAAIVTDAKARQRARLQRLANTPPEQIVWSYQGELGEANWPRLHPTFQSCQSGQRQSPISIDYAIHVNLPGLQTGYANTPFATVDDGRGLSAELLNTQLQLMHRGRPYRLERIRFHRPGEHAVNGMRTDMSAHLIHVNNEGKQLILAVPMNIGPAANNTVQQVIDAFPLESGRAAAAVNPLNPAGLLPRDLRYYEYLGSLTQPPCTEGVLWLMLRQPISISAGQFEVFESLYAPNARSLQADHGRRIKMSP
jgi:carbonic anhydrase